MDFRNIEAIAVEGASIEAEAIAVQELNELQLAMVGGGNAQVVIA